MLKEDIKSEIKKHALEEMPNECCGLLVIENGLERVFKCKNIAKDIKSNFDICPNDYLKAAKLGEIKGYYHSHPNDNNKLSDADKKVSLFHELKLIMYCVGEDEFIEYNE